jgi:hypothetical protein
VQWESEVVAKGTMWASPGPYVRKSMLVTLAKKVGDHMFPEAFYDQTTFSEVDGCASRSKAEEDDLALSMALQLKNEKRNRSVIDEESDESD